MVRHPNHVQHLARGKWSKTHQSSRNPKAVFSDITTPLLEPKGNQPFLRDRDFVGKTITHEPSARRLGKEATQAQEVQGAPVNHSHVWQNTIERPNSSMSPEKCRSKYPSGFCLRVSDHEYPAETQECELAMLRCRKRRLIHSWQR